MKQVVFRQKKGVLEENGKLNERFIHLHEAVTHTNSIESYQGIFASDGNMAVF